MMDGLLALQRKPFNYLSVYESLFLGFLKEDLFIFLQIIFQDFKFFLLLLFYRVTLSWYHLWSLSKAMLSSNIVSEPSEFVFICFQSYMLNTLNILTQLRNELVIFTITNLLIAEHPYDSMRTGYLYVRGLAGGAFSIPQTNWTVGSKITPT